MRKIVLSLLTTLLVVTATAQEVSFHFTDGIYNAGLKAKMERNVSALLNEINAAAGEGRNLKLGGITTSEAATRLSRTWENFGFVSQSDAKSICYGLVSGYQARGIQATLIRQPEDYNESKTRELAISFDKAGNITSVVFTSNNNRLSVPKGESEVYDARRRNEILKFVEDFRNYYIEKDLASLRQIYSDDALIITGKVNYTREEGGDYAAKVKKKTTYTVQDKEGYLNNLAAMFRRNKYIDVQFDDIIISPAGSDAMPNYYGVYLVQHWTSVNKNGGKYQDTGYLFLLWDFNEEPPVVHVRAWQPKDTPDEDFITIDDFR